MMARDRRSERERMVRAQLEGRGITDPAVLEAFRTVPREAFIPPEEAEAAYGDHALPIGHGQTISQPYVVAYMTEAIRPKSDSKILEIGAGSGYQAAILAEIVQAVYTVEIVPSLAQQAQERLACLGYANIYIAEGDGHSGWPEEAPFDGIVVTAAAEEIPSALTEQLKDGGRMIIPIGAPEGFQELTLVEKRNGEILTNPVMGVRFVPFRHKTTE